MLDRGRPGIPFGVAKVTEITARAGSALNYIAALKIVRDAMLTK